MLPDSAVEPQRDDRGPVVVGDHAPGELVEGRDGLVDLVDRLVVVGGLLDRRPGLGVAYALALGHDDHDLRGGAAGLREGPAERVQRDLRLGARQVEGLVEVAPRRPRPVRPAPRVP